ncbi:hypothetical protein WA026_017903 [Henosepilachna vigintioctopunctata]|uniref:Uncharacterized protein n=1 Tax=Henosepilachna vigintioctopunctata TaxID=420089 RepID=A0AAW1TXM0_9CUCU
MKLLVLLAAIIGFANASPSHGYTRTTIKGPSGTIVQETPGAHILKSFLSSKVYAPTFTGAVAVPGPIVAEPVPHIAAPFVETPVVHSVVPEPIVPAPVVPLPAPVVHNAFLHHPAAVPYVLPGSAPFPAAPVPFSPFVDSRVVPVPPFVEPAVPFSAPVPGFRSLLQDQ